MRRPGWRTDARWHLRRLGWRIIRWRDGLADLWDVLRAHLVAPDPNEARETEAELHQVRAMIATWAPGVGAVHRNGERDDVYVEAPSETIAVRAYLLALHPRQARAR